MQDTLDRKPLDRALVERIVRFICFDPMSEVPPGGHLMMLTMRRFGDSNEFFEAVDIVVRNLRELIRIEQIEAQIEVRAAQPEVRPAVRDHKHQRRRAKQPASLPLFDQPSKDQSDE